jgi:tetratricopeptide (TPR) repeat protein
MNSSSAAGRREIRVFVSSTFQDMHAEREELIKRTFPELRRLCAQRGVTWGEVDLRWGVTDEQKAEGRVLPICFEEISRCRPYFIGILGDRYGWVPNEIPPELIKREPWLQEAGGKSVTELEILHGMLDGRGMAEHAFFYFRDPNYIETLPPEQRAVHRSRDEESIQRLRQLKERIRQSGLPVRENYADPQTLGALIRADLTAVIDQCFPEGALPNNLEREAVEHESFARSRTSVYIRRQSYFDHLDRHAEGDGPPLVVLGESGSGKSALLATWVAERRRADDGDFILAHFIGATPVSANWAVMLQRLLHEFNRRFDLNVDISKIRKPEALRLAFGDVLYRAATKSRIILILDGLNQLEDKDQAPDLVWLPPALPANLRLVVSTLPGPAWDELNRRGWPTLTLEPLSVSEQRSLVADYLRQYTKALSHEGVEHIVQHRQAGNPLYLRALLEELRVWGGYEEIDRRIAHYLSAGNVPELFDKILIRYEEDYERERPALVRDAMVLLWASRHGLSEAELMDLLGTGGQPLPRAHWSALYLAAEPWLVNRSGMLTFAHNYLRQAIENKYLAEGKESKEREAHIRLSAYFDGRELDARKVDELPWQMSKAGLWAHLAATLTQPALLQAAWNRNQFEVKECWASIEENSGHRMVDAYRPVLEGVQDAGHGSRVCALLVEHGYTAEAYKLGQHLVDYCERAEDRSNLGEALANPARVLYEWGRFHEALELLQKQEAVYLELGDNDGLQRSYGNQALILAAWGRLEEAMALHKKEEALCLEAGNLDGLQSCYGNEGLILQRWGRLQEALELHKKEEALSREIGQKSGLRNSYHNQAQILRTWGRLEEAMALHKKQEAICRDLGDKSGLGACHSDQANILRDQGQFEAAMALYGKVETLCVELGNKDRLAASYSDRGFILHDSGRFAEAQEMHRRAQAIYLELDNRYGLQNSYGHEALTLRAGGRLEEAMALSKMQEAICLDLANKESLASSYALQAMILTDSGKLEDVFALYQKVEAIPPDLNDKQLLEHCYCIVAAILLKRGRLNEAMVLLKKQEAISLELDNQEALQGCYCGQAFILQQTGRSEEAIAAFQNQGAICQQLGMMQEAAVSLTARALLMASLNRKHEAIELANEAYKIASQAGNTALVEQIEIFRKEW